MILAETAKYNRNACMQHLFSLAGPGSIRAAVMKRDRAIGRNPCGAVDGETKSDCGRDEEP